MWSQFKKIMNAFWVKYLWATPTVQSWLEMETVVQLGPCSQFTSELHSKGKVASKEAFRRIFCPSAPEMPQMAEETMHCVVSTPPGLLQALGHSEASNQWLLSKGLGMGWKKRCLTLTTWNPSAAHGSAWRNKEDMDTQPMTAESVPQLLKLQLAVTEGGLGDNVRKKGKFLSK